MQECIAQAIGEYPVGGELVAYHGAGLEKAAVRRGPQRLIGQGQVPNQKATAGRDGGGAAAEFVEKTTARTDGTVLTWLRTCAMPRSSACWLLFQGATRGSMSKIMVLTASSPARPNRSASPVTRS